MTNNVNIDVPEFCAEHYCQFIDRGKITAQDPFDALEIVARLVLLQETLADQATIERLDGDISRLGELSYGGCLACHLPEIFDQVVIATQSKNPADLYQLAEKLALNHTYPRRQLDA